MALVTFQDLPSTSTPLNSANLNNNFNELNTGLQSLLSKTSTLTTLTTASGTMESGAWRDITVSKNISLETGTYLLIYRVSVTASNSGILTFRPRVATAEASRLTIPIGGNLTVSGAIPYLLNVSTAGNVAVDIQAYANQNFTVGYASIAYIKIN